jgi:decaprenylphospho-beta-D-ribofuranose 2-oxidase
MWGLSMWRMTVRVLPATDRATIAAQSASAARDRTRVQGWGRATASMAAMVHPDGETAWERLVAAPGPRGLIPRGAGSGYGDCAQDAGGVVALTDCPHPTIDIDFRDGSITVDAGVRLRELMQRLVPAGWTLPVLPGTTEVSVGGAIAADIHGKNHPSAGAFSACVEQLRLLTPGLGSLVVSPRQEPDVFWATVGGLGLTGVIRSARLRARRRQTAWMVGTDRVAPNLSSVLRLLAEARGGDHHVVAWLDAHRGGAHMGAGVVTTAREAAISDLPASRRGDPLSYRPQRVLPIPALGWGVVRPSAVAVANRAKWMLARAHPRSRLMPLASVLHPLDAIRAMPGLYGRRGLVQYQFVVPAGAESVLENALALSQRAGCPPSLAVLKMFGRADPAPLSFPRPGWTLALDFPAGAPGLAGVLDELDEQVAVAGGRVYLVKDSRLRPDLLEAMYPGLAHWRAVRDKVDPEHRMDSDLNRRLNLTGRPVAS